MMALFVLYMLGEQSRGMFKNTLAFVPTRDEQR
jgi:hypothetical protein